MERASAMQEGVGLPHVTWSHDGAHQLQGLWCGGGSERVERYGGKKRVDMNTFRNKDNCSIALLKKEREKHSKQTTGWSEAFFFFYDFSLFIVE